MKEIIKIRLDYLQGPIWISDVETGQPITGVDVVDNDEIIRQLNYEIACLYNSYYEFDSHDLPCWFNEEQEKNDKQKMLFLLNQLNERLKQINDGSFVVEDYETDRVRNL